MRPFERHRQKKYKSQILGYLFLLIVVVIFVATVGVKILINTSLFIFGLTQKNKSLTSNNNTVAEIILPPEIFDFPDATNASSLKINGRTSAQKNLLIYVNDELQKELTPDNDTFDTEVQLQKGTNSLYLLIDDRQNKQKKQSKLYTIVYKDEKPFLEITSPRDQEKTSKEEIHIVGKTDKEVFVRINSLPVVTDSEGQFSYQFKLQIGDNKITVEAQDIAGNSEIKELTVIYQKEE